VDVTGELNEFDMEEGSSDEEGPESEQRVLGAPRAGVDEADDEADDEALWMLRGKTKTFAACCLRVLPVAPFKFARFSASLSACLA
jgi:hypothetical protein